MDVEALVDLDRFRFGVLDYIGPDKFVLGRTGFDWSSPDRFEFEFEVDRFHLDKSSFGSLVESSGQKGTSSQAVAGRRFAVHMKTGPEKKISVMTILVKMGLDRLLAMSPVDCRNYYMLRRVGRSPRLMSHMFSVEGPYKESTLAQMTATAHGVEMMYRGFPTPGASFYSQMES